MARSKVTAAPINFRVRMEATCHCGMTFAVEMEEPAGLNGAAEGLGGTDIGGESGLSSLDGSPWSPT